MMSHDQEPVRWRDEADGLPQRFVEGLAQYQQQGPSHEQLARLRQQLPNVATDGVPSASGPKHFATSSWTKGLLGLVLASVFGLWALRSATPTPESEAMPSDDPGREARAQSEALAPLVADFAEVADALPASESPRESQVPSVRPKPPRRSSQALNARPPAPSPDPTAELTLLTRARRLMSSSPEQAFALTREHALSYPAGGFVEERELIAIEALAHANRADEALERARSFLAAHPRSAHGERVRVIVQGLNKTPRDGL